MDREGMEETGWEKEEWKDEMEETVMEREGERGCRGAQDNLEATHRGMQNIATKSKQS